MMTISRGQVFRLILCFRFGIEEGLAVFSAAKFESKPVGSFPPFQGASGCTFLFGPRFSGGEQKREQKRGLAFARRL
jgi:hypothetical protein